MIWNKIDIEAYLFTSIILLYPLNIHILKLLKPTIFLKPFKICPDITFL